jgi:hypothetical protein
VTNFEPTDVEVDPDHSIYDSNRFNNKASATNFSVFPGGAHTFADNEYTVFWIPYAFRRPAEATSIGIRTAIYRYIQSGVALKFETSPENKNTSGEIRYRDGLVNKALHWEFATNKNYNNEYLAQAKLERNPLSTSVPVSSAIYARRYLTKHDPSGFQTVALNIKSPIIQGKKCGSDLDAETEHAPKGQNALAKYWRNKAMGIVSCELTPSSRLNIRLFGGKVQSSGEAPDISKFKVNDQIEAGVRLDASLPKVNVIYSNSLDILLPIPISMPNETFLLSERLKFRLFHDYATGFTLEKHTYQASGIGLLLPFGGDIIGNGALTVTNLSVIAVLFARVDHKTAHSPSVFFSFNADI